jgi:transcriptional regulator with XRE-family HTH domain
MAGTPTMRKKLLGKEMAYLRVREGFDQAEAGAFIGKRQAGIAQIEGGFATLSVGDLEKLLTKYGIDPERDRAEWELCLEWRAGARQPRNYWSGYRAVYSEGFRPFTEMEADCDRLEYVGTESLPDWLQDEPYMRALVGSRPSHDTRVNDYVAARQARQAVFHSENAPELHIVMSESCLRRAFAPPKVMAATISNVIELSKRRNFKIQVLPLAYQPGRAQATIGYRFTRFRIPSSGMAGPVQYVSSTLGKQYQYTDEPSMVSLHGDEFNELSAIAPDYVESRELMIEIVQDFVR